MPEWNPRANDIFAQAAEIDAPADRRLFVEQQCGGDAALRAQVESLLTAGGKIGSFLEQPAVPAPPGGETAAYRPLTEGPGTVIGPYKLLQHIGEGGFGAVYMAEQEHPVRRKVALKIIKLGMDTREVIARFESERQALAMMEHPNIARVFDAGATESGRPYFVMELVRGVPITEFCDKNRFSAEQRLKLFVTVCHAIQHAHHKGIIHRDIKPSNVMVTLHDGVPVVKVIDFGVAKATAQKLTERTLFTAYGQMIGTPAYMSPEQAEMSGLDIDMRSDIFSLGVLLYELLTGTTPLDSAHLRKAGYAEMQRLIREEEAPRPSTRFSSMGGEATVLATNRGTDAKRLSQLLRSDLDWIVMKSLEKDRNRRYGSPATFAADVERYLTEQPVEARPPSTWYRFRKTARRNKAALTTAAVVAAALVVGTAVSAWQAVRAKEAEVASRLSEGDAVRHAATANAERLIAGEERTRAEKERDTAQAARVELRRTLYAAEMNLVQSAWNANEFPRVVAMLDRHRPKHGEPDLRGFEWRYWDRRCNAELSTVTSRVRFGPQTTISPDGRFIATVGTGDKTAVIKVLDATTGQEVFSTPAPSKAPGPNTGSSYQPHLVFSPSGTRLLILWRGRLMVRSVPDNRLLVDKTEFFRNDAVALSDTRVALPVAKDNSPTAGLSTALSVMRIDDGKEEFRRPAPFNPGGVAFSGDGRLLAVRTFPSSKDRPKFELPPDRAATVHILDAASGDEVGKISDLPTLIRFMALNHDGTRLVGWRTFVAGSVDRDPDGGIWDTTTGKQLATVDGLRSHSSLSLGHDLCQRVAFTPDGTRTLWYSPTAEGHPRVSVRDATTGREVVSYDSLAGIDLGAAFTADGTRVRTLGTDGTIKDWHVPPLPPEREKMPIFLATDLSARRILVKQTTGMRKGFKVITTLQVIRQEGGPPIVFDEPARTWEQPSAALSPNGESVAVAERPNPNKGQATTDRLLSVWDGVTGKKRWDQSVSGSPVAVSYTSDGQWVGVLISGQIDRRRAPSLLMFDAASGAPGPTCAVASSVGPIPFSPDGRRVAAVILGDGKDKPDVISVRDLVPDREHRRFIAPAGLLVTATAFSPDGRRVAAGFTSAIVPTTSFMSGKIEKPPENHTGRVVVWDVESGQEVWSTASTYGQVRQLTFSPVGNRLAVTYWGFKQAVPSPNGAVEVVVYDADRGGKRFHLCTDIPNRFALTFDPKGRRIATSQYTEGGRGEVKVWDADTGRELLTLPSGEHAGAIRFTPDGANLSAWGSRSVYAGLPPVWDATPRPEPKQP